MKKRSNLLIQFIMREVNHRLATQACINLTSKLLHPTSKLNLPIAQKCPPSKSSGHKKWALIFTNLDLNFNIPQVKNPTKTPTEQAIHHGCLETDQHVSQFNINNMKNFQFMKFLYYPLTEFIKSDISKSSLRENTLFGFRVHKIESSLPSLNIFSHFGTKILRIVHQANYYFF